MAFSYSRQLRASLRSKEITYMSILRKAKAFPVPTSFPTIDQVGVIERASRFTKRSIKKEAKLQGLNMALNMIDLTTLEGMDTEGKVKQLCYKAQHLHDSAEGIPHVAAICVYPNYVGLAKKELGKSGIGVASVATAFPSGVFGCHCWGF